MAPAARPPRRRSATRLVWTAALALLATGCASSEFRYVRNEDAGAGFKVPSAWTVFDKDRFLQRSEGQGASAPDPIRWLVALDGDPSPSVRHVFNASDLATDHPDGFAMVFSLSDQDRDRMSLSGMRNFLFPVDQLLGLGSDDAVMMNYDDSLSTAEGLRGIRMTFEFRPAALAQVRQDPTGSSSLGTDASIAFSPDFVVVDQTSYLDAQTSRLYLMTLMCSADCYGRYKQQIDDTIRSWTVKP
jgi:hypothetical protein